METKANYVLIGFFTLGVLAAGFAFVHWFRSIGRATVSASYHVIFQGPVGGLRNGATVQFNGMRVGEVSGLELNRDDPKQVIATIKVDANTPVRSDTTVGLDFQGLTGIAAIGLKGGDPTAGPLPEGSDGVPTLVADISATQDITASAREVLRKLDSFVSDNSGTVHTSLKNIESFTETLKSNSERIDRILTTVDKSMAGIELLTGNGDDKNPGQISDTLKSFKTLADDVDQKTLRHLDGLISTARSALATFDRAVTNFDRNPSRVIFGGGSPATPAAPAPAAASGTRRAQ
jgi:phospholipid/cholesterol/gamma-HCH transport system substrate-binding protein